LLVHGQRTQGVRLGLAHFAVLADVETQGSAWKHHLFGVPVDDLGGDFVQG
jgi:hypothetical protein